MLRQSNAEVLNPTKSRYKGFVRNLIIINVSLFVKKFNFSSIKIPQNPTSHTKMASGTSQTSRETTQQYLISLRPPKVTKTI